MKKGAVKGKQVFFYQLVTGNDIVIYREAKQRADLVIVVIGKSLAVGHKHKEKVQEQFISGEAGKKAASKKTVADPAKLPSIFLMRLQTRGFLLTMCSSRMTK